MIYKYPRINLFQFQNNWQFNYNTQTYKAQFIPTPVTKEPSEIYLTIIKNKLTQNELQNDIVKIIHAGDLSSSHNSKGVEWFLNQSLPFLKKMSASRDKCPIRLLMIASLKSGLRPNICIIGKMKGYRKNRADFCMKWELERKIITAIPAFL